VCFYLDFVVLGDRINRALIYNLDRYK
jgi:hypothetical protein